MLLCALWDHSDGLHAPISKAGPAGCLMHPLAQRTSSFLTGGSSLCGELGGRLVAHRVTSCCGGWLTPQSWRGSEGVRCPPDASYRRGCLSSKRCSGSCALGSWRGVGEYAFSTFFLFHLVCSLKIGKNRRLKQAKEEAQAEIEQYRLQREKEFKAKEAAVCFLDHSVTYPTP